jgi:hypothetical protein
VFADTFVPAESVALLVPLVAEPELLVGAVVVEGVVVEPPQAVRPRASSVAAQAMVRGALMVDMHVSNRGLQRRTAGCPKAP